MTDARKNLIFNFAVFAFTVLWFGVFAVTRIDLHHDAVMLKPAIDVAAGKVIFRDTFCQYGALAVWLQALAVKLFGGEIVVIQLLTVFFYGGCAVVSDLIFRRFLSFPFRLINLALFWGMAPFYIVPMHPWSSVYALFFMLLTEEFILRFFESGRGWELFGAGSFAACAFLARHPCGAAIFAAGAAAVGFYAIRFRRSWSAPAWYVAGTASILGAFALYLAVVGAWRDYLVQCFGFVLAFAVERGGNMNPGEIAKRFFPFNEVLWLVDTIYSLLPLFCMALLLLAMRRFFGEAAERNPAVGRRALQYIMPALAGLASWHQYYPVPCVRHLYWAAIPMFGVFALFAERLWRSGRCGRWGRALAVLLLLAGAVPIAFRFYYGSYPLIKYFPLRRTVDLPGCRHLWLSPRERELLSSLAGTFEALPPEIKARGFFNYTPDAVFSVAFPQTGFKHKMFVNWRRDVYSDYPESAMNYIFTHRPPVLTQQPMALPGYILLWRGELYGLEYWFYSPLR